MEGGPYDIMIVAGEEPYRLSGSLYCLARDVGIPLPQFYGRQVYYDGNGAEKWLITTLIQGRIGEDDDPGVCYTQAYPDWCTSVEMAIHGAMSRIIFRYRDHVPRSGAFRFFGERDEDGDAIDSNDEHITHLRAHIVERKALAVGTESLLQKQIAVIDEQRAKIKRMEIAILNMDAIIEGSKDKERQKDAITFAIQAQGAFFAEKSNEMDQVKENNKALQEEIEVLQKKMAQMTVIQEEKKPQEEPELIPENQVEGAEDEEEGDPEEREPWSTSDEKSSPERDQQPKKRTKASEFYAQFTPPARDS